MPTKDPLIDTKHNTLDKRRDPINFVVGNDTPPQSIEHPRLIIFENIEEVLESVEIPTPPISGPPGRGQGGRGGERDYPDVKWLSPKEKLMSGYLKWVFILIAVVFGITVLGILGVSFLDYMKFSHFLSNSSNWAAFEEFMEATKNVSDLTIARLSSILQISMGLLIGLFLGIINKFKDK